VFCNLINQSNLIFTNMVWRKYKYCTMVWRKYKYCTKCFDIVGWA